MSILRAKTQMLKEKQRLFSKVEETEKKKLDLDKVIEALRAQIVGINTALDSMFPPADNPDGN